MHVILAQGYTNPVIDSNNPDPSAIALPDGGYLAVATSNHASVSSGEDAFPIYYSDNLVDWELKGYVFPSGLWPGYCDRNMWAPEIHHVNGRLISKMPFPRSGNEKNVVDNVVYFACFRAWQWQKMWAQSSTLSARLSHKR